MLTAHIRHNLDKAAKHIFTQRHIGIQTPANTLASRYTLTPTTMLIPGPSTQKPSAHMATHEYKSIKTSRSVRYNDAIEIWNEELCLCDRTKVPKQLHSSRKARDGRHPARISKRDKTNPSYSIDRWLAAGPQDSPPTISTAYQDRAWAAANKAEEMILQGGMKVQMAPPKLDDDIVCLGTWADDELDEYYDPYVMVAIE